MTLLSQKAGRFYDTWEETPSEVRNKVRLEKLEEYIRFASQLPFYKDRLASFDPKSSHPLKDVPLLTSGDLRKLVPPQGNGLVVPETDSYTVFQSGGTTGIPKTTLFSHEELDALDLPNARGFYACGLRAEDKVANLFAVGSLYMTFVHINRMLQGYGCINFPFANNTLSEFVHTVSSQFQINTFAGVSSIVLNTLREWRKQGLSALKIEKIFYGGEHLYESDKKELRDHYGTEVILAPGYGTVDTWYIGYQCSLSPTGVFHAHDDQCYIEIVDPETGELCQPGERGMLYATAFPRRITPIVRYQVGDLAEWQKESCPCGRTTPVFRLLGRGDDVLRIGYDSFDYDALQKMVLDISGLTGSVRMEKHRQDGKDRLVVRVESEASPSEYARLAQVLKAKIEELRPGIFDLTRKGLIWPTEVEVVSLGVLPRNARTGKLIRVWDGSHS